MSTVERVRAAVENACERTSGELVVDLSRVDFVDSHGLQLLVNTHRRLVAEGCSLVVVPPAQHHVRRAFALTGLDSFFRDEPAAGAAAQGRRD